MDHVVDHHGGLTENSVAGAKRSKSCLSTSLSKAFASPQKVKSRTSSNESEYEVVAEIDNEDSDNEACSAGEGDHDESDNNVLVGLNNTSKINHTQKAAPSEPVEMDEIFVIVDDDAEMPDENTEPREAPNENTDHREAPNENTEPREAPNENTEPREAPNENTEHREAPNENTEPREAPNENTEPREAPNENTELREIPEEKRNCLSDGDDLEMDEIIAEFAEQEKKTVPQLSDSEEEMDSILNEFAKTSSNDSTNNKKSDANIILSSEGEDEMDCLLEEFRKENTSDKDTLAKKTVLQSKDKSCSNYTEKSSDNVTNTCDNKNDNVCDSINKFQSSSNSISLSHNDQKNCGIQEHNSSTDKNSIPVKSDCIIICDTDDKSNNSNCSSVEILLDDDPVEEVNQIISVSKKEMSSEVLGCSVSKSPSNNVSDAEKNGFNKTTLNTSGEDSSCVNSNIEATNDICTNIFDTNASETSTSLTESSEKSNLSSMDKIIDIVNVNSKDETNDQIKNAERSEENLPVNKILNENEPSPINKQKKSCDAENHSDDFSKITDDQIVSNNNEVKPSNDEESNALSETNEKVTSEKNTDVDSIDIVKGDISSGDAEEETDKKSVHEDQTESFREQKEDKITLNDNPVADGSTLSKELNETSVDKGSEQSEVTMETNVVNNNSQSEKNNEDETLTVESQSDEVEKIKLDTEENCSTTGLQTKVKQFSDTTKSCLDEDVYISVDSPLSGEFSSTSDYKKRKLEDVIDIDSKKQKLEDEIDIDSKKLKIDNIENGDSNYLSGEENLTSNTSGNFGLKNTNIEELVSDVNVANHKAVDKINTLIPWDTAECIETTKSVLGKIAIRVCQEVVKECFQKMYNEDKNIALELERKSESLSKNIDALRLQFADIKDAQKIAFAEQDFKAKESEIKQALTMQSVLKNKPDVILETPSVKSENPELKTEPKTEPSSLTSVPSSIKAVKTGVTQLLVPNANIKKDTVITPMVTPQQTNIRRQLLPRIIAQASRPVVAAQVMSRMMAAKIPPPNMTVNGNRLVPLVSSRGRTPSTQSVVLVPSSTITASSRNNLIDLTKEDQARNAANNCTSIPNTTVAKVTVPGNFNNSSNLLVPLREYLQILPPGTKGAPILQQAPVSRPALIPQLPSSLLGARTVTYLVPQNSGIGARGIPQFNQFNPSNQQVQFVLRVTTPGTAPTLGTIVNSIPRPATMPQTQVTAAPRPSSGLILFSHTTKHPAPFPKSPHYPDTKGKALPPKPSLKGNKNSNGIVLSWNMCLMRNHANISSYQLFAYQETEGPVDSSLWKKVGDVNALPLPMACTLTQFVDKNRYFFTVRAVDTYQRFGPFSDPVSILYDKEEASSTKK